MGACGAHGTGPGGPGSRAARLGPGPPRFDEVLAGFDAVALDLPGYGVAPEPPGPWSTAEYAEWVAPVLHELGGGPVVVLGHSFGARVAVHLAAAEAAPAGRGPGLRALVLTGAPLAPPPGKCVGLGRRSPTGPGGLSIGPGSSRTSGWNGCAASTGRTTTAGQPDDARSPGKGSRRDGQCRLHASPAAMGRRRGRGRTGLGRGRPRGLAGRRPRGLDGPAWTADLARATVVPGSGHLMSRELAARSGRAPAPPARGLMRPAGMRPPRTEGRAAMRGIMNSRLSTRLGLGPGGLRPRAGLRALAKGRSAGALPAWLHRAFRPPLVGERHRSTGCSAPSGPPAPSCPSGARRRPLRPLSRPRPARLGLALRGRTSKLAWTGRLRRLADRQRRSWRPSSSPASGRRRAPRGASTAAACALSGRRSSSTWLSGLPERPEARLLAPYVSKASQRLRSVGPRVVAITGSYGKTTTKGYVAHSSAVAMSVVASPASFNNTAGLARAINDHLATRDPGVRGGNGHLRAGRDRAMCAWAPPEVAVITALGPVHLERMGSLETHRGGQGGNPAKRRGWPS